MRKGQVTIYFNSSKEENYNTGVECGLTGKALDMFMYALYEVKFECVLNMDTGEAIILKVNGRELANPPPFEITEDECECYDPQECECETDND